MEAVRIVMCVERKAIEIVSGEDGGVYLTKGCDVFCVFIDQEIDSVGMDSHCCDQIIK